MQVFSLLLWGHTQRLTGGPSKWKSQLKYLLQTNPKTSLIEL